MPPSVVLDEPRPLFATMTLHDLKAMAPNPRNHIAFPGFQVAGTRGGKLMGGVSEVKIHGEYVPVKAEVSQIEGFSAMPTPTD